MLSMPAQAAFSRGAPVNETSLSQLPLATISMIVLLSDDPSRSSELAKAMRRVNARFVIAPFGSEPCRIDKSRRVRAIVSDVSLNAADKVEWIRDRLDERWAKSLPYYCLLDQDTSREHLQANALGATKAIAPQRGVQELESALLALIRTPPAPSALLQADDAFFSIFKAARGGKDVSPAMVSSCSSFIETALRDLGVRAMLEMIWRFDDATHQHCMLVAGLAAAFSMSLGFRSVDAQRLTDAALLHDVGKSRIPIEILNKPDRLTDEERATMNAHPVIGFEMLQGQGHADEVLAVVRSHHEALDGSGYPDRLPAARIPDLVRLVTVCDIFAALIERRPYKKPFGGDEAYRILCGMAGKVDIALAQAFRPIAMEAAVHARETA